MPDGLEPGRTGYVRFMNGETLGKGRIMNDGSEADDDDVLQIQVAVGAAHVVQLEALDLGLAVSISLGLYSRFRNCAVS